MTETAQILKNQNAMLEELKQLRKKVALLGSLQRFEELAKRGKKFAKARKITLEKVLQDD